MGLDRGGTGDGSTQSSFWELPNLTGLELDLSSRYICDMFLAASQFIC